MFFQKYSTSLALSNKIQSSDSVEQKSWTKGKLLLCIYKWTASYLASVVQMALKRQRESQWFIQRAQGYFALLLKGLMHHCFEELSSLKKCINGQRLKIEKLSFQT